MTASFVVRPEAEADIDEAYEWYEERLAGLGDRFLDAVEDASTALREAPQRFPVMHEEPELQIRRALVDVFPYGVFFIWDQAENVISVIACMHARRDPRRWLSRA